MANDLVVGIRFDTKKLSTEAYDKLGQAMNMVKDVAKELGITMEESGADIQRQLNRYNKQIEAITKKRDALLAQTQGGAAGSLLPDMTPVSSGVAQTTRQFDQLGFSIQQVARELPAFTYSATTGFMAISNNLPMLADAIMNIRQQNEALRASGQKTVPVWKQVAASLLSWQTAMMVGITLMTVYGAEITKAIARHLSFGNALDAAAEAQKQVVDAQKKGTEEAQKELTTLNLLYQAATNDSRSREERLSAVRQLQSEYPAYFSSLSNETILAGGAADAYSRLAHSLTDAAIARASMDKMAENATRLLDLTDQQDAIARQLEQATEYRDKLMQAPIVGEGGADALNKAIQQVNGLERSLRSVKGEIDALNAANQKLASGINISSLEGNGKGSSGKAINTNLQTIGGITNKINELREAQNRATLENAVNIEREIQLYQQKLNLMQRTIAQQAAGNLGKGTFDPLNLPELPSFPVPTALTIPVQFDVATLQRSWRECQVLYSDSIKEIEITGRQISGMLTGALTSFASGLGEAIASGSGLEAMQALLSSIMGMLQQFGSALIAAGVASQAFKSLFSNPVLGIVAGAALVTAASAAKAALQNVTALAQGGISYGPTLALVGEYSGARSNPEVIAPLDRLQSLIQPAYSPTDVIRVEGVIRGKDIYVASRRAEHNLSRVR